MLKIILVISVIGTVGIAKANGCGCSSGSTVLKDVMTRESASIVARDGMVLKANFVGASEGTATNAPVTSGKNNKFKPALK